MSGRYGIVATRICSSIRRGLANRNSSVADYDSFRNLTPIRPRRSQGSLENQILGFRGIGTVASGSPTVPSASYNGCLDQFRKAELLRCRFRSEGFNPFSVSNRIILCGVGGPASSFSSESQTGRAPAGSDGLRGRYSSAELLERKVRKAGSDRSQNMLMYLLAMVVGVVGVTYASVPLYRRFCQATGYGGTTQRREVISSYLEFLCLSDAIVWIVA